MHNIIHAKDRYFIHDLDRYFMHDLDVSRSQSIWCVNDFMQR